MSKNLIRTKEGAVFSPPPEYLGFMRDMVKRVYGQAPLDSASHPAWRELAMLSISGPEDQRTRHFMETAAMQSFFLGGCLSVFVEDRDVVDFAFNSGFEQSDGLVAFHSAINLLDGGSEKTIMIHMPKPSPSILVQIFKSENHAFMFFAYKDVTSYYRVRDDGHIAIPVERGSGDCAALNVLMYMCAFDDCVRTGPPNITKPFSGDSCHVVSSKEFSVSQSNARAFPHLRRGHFRLLKSERYTNARGKVVYVKPTMVKGKAVTVHG